MITTDPGDVEVVDGGPGDAGSALDACLSACGWVASGPSTPFSSVLDD